MGKQKRQPGDPDTTELLDIDVSEVSLVSKPAIKRKFVRTKNVDAQSAPAADAPADPAPATTEAEPAAEPVAEQKLISKEVAKAVAPMLTALAEERLALASAQIEMITEKLNAGTLTTEECWQHFNAVYNMLYKAESEVRALAEVMGVQSMVTVVTKAEIERVSQILKALNLVEEEDMSTNSGNTATNTPAAAPAAAAVTIETIKSALGEALQPLEQRIQKLETAQAAPPAQPAQTQTTTQKSETDPLDAVSERLLKVVTKAMEPVTTAITEINGRLDALEGTSSVPTEQKTTEIEAQKSDADPVWGSFFGNI